MRPKAVLSLKTGPDWKLEDQANQLIFGARRQMKQETGYHLYQINDILSEDQFELRRNREVYVTSGIPEGTYLRGQYGRAYNPLWGSRPNAQNRFSRMMDAWHQDAWETVNSEGYFPGFIYKKQYNSEETKSSWN